MTTQESCERARVEFVFAELTAAIASCKIARSRHRLGLDPTIELKQAEGALVIVAQSMQKLETSSLDLQRMKVLTKNLRTEFDALHKDLERLN